MKDGITHIEIAFPTPVELTNDDQRLLDAVAAHICNRYRRAHPDRVMWPFGVGFKPTFIPMTREQEQQRGIEFDESTFQIDCHERENYDWLCAKCGKPQGEHGHCIIEPEAGACEYQPAPGHVDEQPAVDFGLAPASLLQSTGERLIKARQALSERISPRDAEYLREAALMLGRWFEAVPDANGQISFNEALLQAAELDLIAAFYPLRELCPHTALDQRGGCCRTCGINVEDIPAKAETA